MIRDVMVMVATVLFRISRPIDGGDGRTKQFAMISSTLEH